ncbi:MAG: prephenate dehydrogenase/arogenate dehydrogenase family protein [Verrucomicrobiota bacterium]
MKALAILGPGLLGGSIALAARRVGGYRIALWARRQEAVAEALAMGIADVVSGDLAEVVGDADLVILCVPVGAMPQLAREVVNLIGTQTIVTDVGSVKGIPVEALSLIFSSRGRFVGSHPMAGSEKTGIQVARANLFDDAVCFLTPDAFSTPEAVRELRAFWESFGSRVVEASPASHDEIVALISHLPHLLAATLMQTVVGENVQALELCGSGFRDCTRIASGSPVMWAEILRTNRDAVRKAAESMMKKLGSIISVLDDDEATTQFLSQAKMHRDRLTNLK